MVLSDVNDRAGPCRVSQDGTAPLLMFLHLTENHFLNVFEEEGEGEGEEKGKTTGKMEERKERKTIKSQERTKKTKERSIQIRNIVNR